VVGDVAGELLFQVQFADASFMSIREQDLVALGFQVARVGTAMAKVTFEADLIYALPIPSAPMIASRSTPVKTEEPVN